MLLKEVLAKSTEFLKSKSIETPRLDAEILLAHILKLNRIDLYLKHELPLKENEVVNCREVIVRRGKGEPVAYITQSKGFYGHDFYVDKNVLIPRPETEELVELAIKLSETLIPQTGLGRELRIVDLGCGSGAIGLSVALALEVKKISYHITLVDLSNDALLVAKKNEQNLFTSIADKIGKIEFQNIDAAMLTSSQSFDLVLGNPPYIRNNDPDVQKQVNDFEPHMALYSGPEGDEFLKKWADQMIPLMSERSALLFEMGHLQGPKMKDHLTIKSIFSQVEVIKDYSERDRLLLAKRGI